MVSPLLVDVLPEQVLTVTCTEGYEKNPRVDLECVYAGGHAQYNHKLPVCERTSSTCNTPQIQNGYVDGPEVRSNYLKLLIHEIGISFTQ